MTPRETLAVRFARVLKTVVAAALVVVCAVVGATPLAADGPASNYIMAAWATEKGLPPGDVFAIAQDADGYLWLGTPNGLIRFDGSRFTPWTPSSPASALPSGPVHSIVASPDGSLWVGFGGGAGVVRIHRDEVYQHAAADGAPAGATAMIQDRQGAIWVATRRGSVPIRERTLDADGPGRRLQRRGSLQPLRGSRRAAVGGNGVRRLSPQQGIVGARRRRPRPTCRASPRTRPERSG